MRLIQLGRYMLSCFLVRTVDLLVHLSDCCFWHWHSLGVCLHSLLSASLSVCCLYSKQQQLQPRSRVAVLALHLHGSALHWEAGLRTGSCSHGDVVSDSGLLCVSPDSSMRVTSWTPSAEEQTIRWWVLLSCSLEILLQLWSDEGYTFWQLSSLNSYLDLCRLSQDLVVAFDPDGHKAPEHQGSVLCNTLH